MGSEYAEPGVAHSKLNLFKREMSEMAMRTLEFPRRRGVAVRRDGLLILNRSSPFVVGKMIDEDLGNKMWVAEWMYQEEPYATYFRGIGIDTAMMAVVDLLRHGAMPVVFNAKSTLSPRAGWKFCRLRFRNSICVGHLRSREHDHKLTGAIFFARIDEMKGISATLCVAELPVHCSFCCENPKAHSMPELPEVEITRRKLLPLIKDRRVLSFWTDWPKSLKISSRSRFAGDIAGRTIRAIRRQGKVLFFDLSGKPERVMAVHLRMSGRLELVPVAQKPGLPSPRQRRWVHGEWRLSNRRELCLVDPRKFAQVWYGSRKALRRDPYLGRLGQDAQGISRKNFFAQFAGRRGAIKPLLLRQDVIAGIGNIIADEALWRAKIHPQTNVVNLGSVKMRELHHAIHRSIAAMLASGGTTLRNWSHPDGAMGRFQERRLVYGKAGRPCRRCRKKLERIVVGGRGTTVCPQCQTIYAK